MTFGCSQCLAIAIKYHRLDLMLDLLQRPVPTPAYREMFWEPTSRMHEDVDWSRIGRADCGHEIFDEELRTRIPTVAVSSRKLTSLVILARQNTYKGFPAEQLLRDSGKFDFNEPQFYHETKSNPLDKPATDEDSKEDIKVTRRRGQISNNPWIFLNFEIDCPAVHWSFTGNLSTHHLHNNSMNVWNRNTSNCTRY